MRSASRLISHWHLTILLACTLLAVAHPRNSILEPDQDKSDNSNLIFASLHSLLKSWSQAYAPNGHAIVPVTVRPGTLLYHMGGLPTPRGMNWFAFDAEHSYMFGGGWISAPYQRVLYTFVANRPLRALYFDGFSAAKIPNGPLDLQNVLANGSASGIPHHAEDMRGKLLCEWGKQFGIEGFVREEATFELLWCDFTNGVHLVESTNTASSSDQKSAWFTSPVQEPVLMKAPQQSCSLNSRFQIPPFAAQAEWSFYHAASWHHHVPDSRIVLHASYLVSLYDPKYSSLEGNNQLPIRYHNLSDISSQDVKTFTDEVGQALNAWRSKNYGELGSGIDWSSIAKAAVDRNGNRLAEMRELLRDTAADSAVVEAVSRIRLVAYALVMPYLDVPSTFSPSASNSSRDYSLSLAAQRCTVGLTGHLDKLNMKLTIQELRLKAAIEGVLSRICSFTSEVLGSSTAFLEELEGHSRETELNKGRQLLKAWGEKLEKLMQWLGWAMWQRCPRPCAWNEQCFVPMWPVHVLQQDLGHMRTQPQAHSELEAEPRCIKINDLMRS